MPIKNEVTFEAFREQWLADIQKGDPSTVDLGRYFSHKLMTQWRDVDQTSSDLVYCDGSGDGGIDIACLDREEEEKEKFCQHCASGGRNGIPIFSF